MAASREQAVERAMDSAKAMLVRLDRQHSALDRGRQQRRIRQAKNRRAIDHHVIARSERLFRTSPHPFALLKWPIVEISQALEHEEDYLNLLKAELFVVGQVYKRANFADTLNRYFLALRDAAHYQRLRHTTTNEAFFHRQLVRDAASHWLRFTEKKRKLRRLLQGTPAE